jgi:hypothetical protein
MSLRIGSSLIRNARCGQSASKTNAEPATSAIRTIIIAESDFIPTDGARLQLREAETSVRRYSIPPGPAFAPPI